VSARAHQRIDGRPGLRIVLVACSAEDRSHAGGRDQPAKRIPPLCSFDHVFDGHPKDLENAVKVDREHVPPFLFGAVNERAPTTAARAGIGKHAIDPSEYPERTSKGRFHRAAFGHVACSHLNLAAAMAAQLLAGARVFSPRCVP
jgi:hypothetical protein